MRTSEHWWLSNRWDTRALPLANRHYNRQKIGTPQFVSPGRNVVLLTAQADALWVTTWPQFVSHNWPGAWVCTLFRNESQTLSSELIKEAVAISRWKWGEPPEHGMITFINRSKVRKKRDFGRCYLRAGFKVCGETKVNKLLVVQLLPIAMPLPIYPLGAQMALL